VAAAAQQLPGLLRRAILPRAVPAARGSSDRGRRVAEIVSRATGALEARSQGRLMRRASLVVAAFALLGAACGPAAAQVFTPLATAWTPTAAPPQRNASNPSVEVPSVLFPPGLTAYPTNAWWTSWVEMTGTDTVAVGALLRHLRASLCGCGRGPRLPKGHRNPAHARCVSHQYYSMRWHQLLAAPSGQLESLPGPPTSLSLKSR
jgi:hypothetical protein